MNTLACAMAGRCRPTDAALVSNTIRAALDRWGAGQPHATGDFLRAVLTNDLAGAVARADDDNLLTLAAIVAYVAQQLPLECYGTEAKYEAWISRHRELHEQQREQLQDDTDVVHRTKAGDTEAAMRDLGIE